MQTFLTVQKPLGKVLLRVFCCAGRRKVQQDAKLTPHGNWLRGPVRHELKLKRVKKESRLVIVGDVHGCLHPLKRLLKEVNFHQKRDYLLFTGDLVNKGPNCCEVLDLALKYDAWSVRGNHDDYALALYHELSENPKKDEWVVKMSKQHVEYLDTMPFILEIPSLKIIIVHAGLVPGVPLDEQDLSDLYKIRCLVQSGDSWIGKEMPDSGIPWVEAWNGPHHVIFGHDALKGIQRTEFATGLDAGCVYGGQLAAAILPIGKLYKADTEFIPTRENLGIQIISVSND